MLGKNENMYFDKKVVVTGGAGFIGVNLVRELHDLGTRITVVDLPTADFSHLPPSINIVPGDILDQTICETVCSDADYVFHLAARTDLDGRNLEDYKVNYEGTANLIQACRNNKHIKRFALFSTQLVVGIFNETRFIDQNEPCRTKTLYGHSKIQAEEITVRDCLRYGIPYVIIRPTSVYGQLGREPYREYFLTIKNRQYFHIGKADNLVSMVYVKNVVDQTLFLSSHEQAKNQVFFSNDLVPYTMREFSDAVGTYFGYRIPTIPDFVAYPAAYLLGILKIFGLSVPLYPFRLKNIKANYCYNIGNSLRLGFFPGYGLHEGIKKTLDWYMNSDNSFR